MNQQDAHIFDFEEAALAYAITAEKMIEGDGKLLEAEPAVVPIFVTMLYQSLEISLKHVGIESNLFNRHETFKKQTKKGHGVEDLARLAYERLGSSSYDPIIAAMTYNNCGHNSALVIREMIYGDRMSKTREVYASRRLGYGEIGNSDFALINPLEEWVCAVKETAENIQKAIDIISQWHKSSSINSENFLIRFD